MLLNGVNHVALLTRDTDRLHAFYRDVFDATVSADRIEQPGVRLSFVDIGPTAELNVFQVDDNTEADRQTPMFGRGRIDHIGLQAASSEAFDTIRQRLIDVGATDGFVTDFGPVLSLFFHDPDGLEGEVCVTNPAAKPGVVNPPGTPAEGYEQASEPLRSVPPVPLHELEGVGQVGRPPRRRHRPVDRRRVDRPALVTGLVHRERQLQGLDRQAAAHLGIRTALEQRVHEVVRGVAEPREPVGVDRRVVGGCPVRVPDDQGRQVQQLTGGPSHPHEAVGALNLEELVRAVVAAADRHAGRVGHLHHPEQRPRSYSQIAAVGASKKTGACRTTACTLRMSWSKSHSAVAYLWTTSSKRCPPGLWALKRHT